MNRNPTDISHRFEFLCPTKKLGVYILIKDENILYVGNSTNVLFRVAKHYRGSGSNGSTRQENLASALRSNFNKVQFIEENDRFWRAVLEEFCIWKYNPSLNIRGHNPVPRSYSDDEAWAFIVRIKRSREAWKNIRRSI